MGTGIPEGKNAIPDDWQSSASTLRFSRWGLALPFSHAVHVPGEIPTREEKVFESIPRIARITRILAASSIIKSSLLEDPSLSSLRTQVVHWRKRLESNQNHLLQEPDSSPRPLPQNWSQDSDLNPRPSDWKAAALPLSYPRLVPPPVYRSFSC